MSGKRCMYCGAKMFGDGNICETCRWKEKVDLEDEPKEWQRGYGGYASGMMSILTWKKKKNESN